MVSGGLIEPTGAVEYFSPASDSSAHRLRLTLTAQIQDNYFLLEEAYNQEAGVVQHISNYARTGGDWAFPSPRNGHSAASSISSATPFRS